MIGAMTHSPEMKIERRPNRPWKNHENTVPRKAMLKVPRLSLKESSVDRPACLKKYCKKSALGPSITVGGGANRQVVLDS